MVEPVLDQWDVLVVCVLLPTYILGHITEDHIKVVYRLILESCINNESICFSKWFGR